MSNRLYALPKMRQQTLSGVQTTSLRRRVLRHFVSAVLGLMLIVVVLLLSACHTLPEKPCEPQKLPIPPALLQPLPLVPYLKQSQQSDENSVKKLTGM